MTRKLLFAAAALGFAVSPVSAQWLTESHTVRAGWNAIYPFVDASDVTLDTLLALETRIEEIWRWNPDALNAVALHSPSEPIIGVEWTVWRRGNPAETTMNRLRANYAYLVKVADNPADPSPLLIKGKVVMPRVSWRNDGLNLVGFPAASEGSSPPTIGSYLAPASLLGANFRYMGGPISESNPEVLLNAVHQDIPRGEAFWVDTGSFSDYYGPIKVEVSLSQSGLSFGDTGSIHQVVLTNRTDRAITVTLTPTPCQSPRGGEGQELRQVPLLERVFDEDSQAFTYSAFDGPKELTLQVQETVSKIVALNRDGLDGVQGTEYASLLVVTDSEGMSRIDLPVSATIGGTGGLWVGEALISRVQNQLQQFQRDANGQYLYDGGGRIPLAATGDTSINRTAQAFPIRLIVHADASGAARLLSNVYAGPIAPLEAGAVPQFGIATAESRLVAGSRAQSVRLTAVHFPLDLNLELNGSFGTGSTLTGTVTLAHNAKENPFIHTFHPDHDNLDARFKNGLPAGDESHTVTRRLSLAFDVANPDGNPDWGSQFLTGTFTEEVTGIHKDPLSVEGKFSLRRLHNAAMIYIHTP
jgi:hypothetical protein